MNTNLMLEEDCDSSFTAHDEDIILDTHECQNIQSENLDVGEVSPPVLEARGKRVHWEPPEQEAGLRAGRDGVSGEALLNPESTSGGPVEGVVAEITNTVALGPPAGSASIGLLVAPLGETPPDFSLTGVTTAMWNSLYLVIKVLISFTLPLVSNRSVLQSLHAQIPKLFVHYRNYILFLSNIYPHCHSSLRTASWTSFLCPYVLM